MFLGIEWGKFLQPQFWLETTPGGLSTRFEIIFFVILIVCYGLYVLAQMLRKRLAKEKNTLYSKYWNQVSSMFLTLAITFTFIFFFRYEAIPYLGGRYWFFIWAVVGITWFVYLLIVYYKKLPEKVRKIIEKKEKQKYL